MTPPLRLVPAVERAVAILDLIAANGPQTLAELARTLGLPKSSAHGLCQTLCHFDLLRETHGRYSAGMRSLRWTNSAMGETELIAEFRALLPQEDALAGYTITLSSLDGTDVIYLACHNSDAPLGVTFRIGMRLPAAFTATGKAMLAHLPEMRREAILAQPLPPPMTADSVRSISALRREIEGVRKHGFSLDDGQIRSGMCCIGAAVLDSSGNAVAGVALSMTATEARPEVIAKAGTAVARFALRLSRRTGFTA